MGGEALPIGREARTMGALRVGIIARESEAEAWGGWTFPAPRIVWVAEAPLRMASGEL